VLLRPGIEAVFGPNAMLNTPRERLSNRSAGRMSPFTVAFALPIADSPVFLSLASCGLGSRALIEVDQQEV
jgi:hypothetical protein